MDEENIPKRPRRISVLAYGEGEDEKVFLRHLVALYVRKQSVSVQTADAGGGDPTSILDRAIRTRSGDRHDIEFILLDTIPPWPQDMIEKAEKEEILLIGNSPCLESFFFEILGEPAVCSSLSPWNCKKSFEQAHCASGNFSEEECQRIFTKAILNAARSRVSNLDRILKIIEGNP